MKKRLIIFLLLSFPLLLAAQEKVFYNAKIFAANAQKPYAEAIAWKGKTIVAVGSVEEIKKAVSKNAEWTDLNGSFLMPGFVCPIRHGCLRNQSQVSTRQLGQLLRDAVLQASCDGEFALQHFLMLLH